MTTYYEVTALHTTMDRREVLHGSFLKSECKEEIGAERDQWKEQGYKAIKITSRATAAVPDQEVYGELVTPKELWLQQAPSFNFELDEDELLEAALEKGYVELADYGNDLYLVNPDY